MNDPESLRSAVEAVASNPRVATAVAAGTASLGTAASLQMLQSSFGLASLIIGCITGMVVLAIQSIKLVRLWREK